MKSIILFFTAFIILSTNQLFAQGPKDTIEVKKGLSTSFMLNGRKLTPKQLLILTESNPEAHQQMKIARSNYTPGYIISSVGGFLIGWQLGTAIAGGDANWTAAGIGGGLILASIPFSTAYVKHTKKAVAAYNKGLNQTTKNRAYFYPGLTANGVGITMRF